MLRGVFRICLFVGLAVLPPGLAGQSLEPAVIDELAREQAEVFIREFYDFLTLPNDAHYPEQLEENIKWLEKAYAQRGFRVRRLPTAGIDLVLAEYDVKDADRSILFYLHLDGQPVDPGKWDQADPFQPTLKRLREDGRWVSIPWKSLVNGIDPEWRLYGRSAADDKGPIGMFLAAWDAFREAGGVPPYNVRIIFDTEEEIGSPHLAPAVELYRDLLRADGLVIMDGPMHPGNRPTLVFGARGIASLELTVYGPREPQHSGHYGNYVPNPALRLSQLLASMKDEQGRVIIPGFYDGIELDPETRAVLARVPDDEVRIRERLGIAEAEKVGDNLQEALQYPSLNVMGFSSGWTGDEVRTIVPATAVAEIDLRLVRESDADRLIRLIREHIEGKGYHILDGEPTEAERLQYPRLLRMHSEISYQAFRTPMDAVIGKWLNAALTRTHGEAPVLIRGMGGSVPIAPFLRTLNVPAVILPLVNSDNNQHSPNENLRMGNFVQGIKTLIGVLGHPF